MSPAPFADDGRLQTQNPCTPTTSVLTYYNEWEMWDTWSINIDTNHEAYSIRAQNYNGKVPRCVRRTSPSPMSRGSQFDRAVCVDFRVHVVQALPDDPAAVDAPHDESDGHLVRVLTTRITRDVDAL